MTRRNEEIEVLRAVAVCYVIFEHINTLFFWRHYNLEDVFYTAGGVDLFFAISGFVITSSFSSELRNSADQPSLFWPTVSAFWTRRAFRIIPLSWSVLVLSSAFYMARWGVPWKAILGDAVAVTLNIENFHYASCATSTGPLCGPQGIYWSLSLEEQFYIAFPFLFLVSYRWRVLFLALVTVFYFSMYHSSLIYMIRLDAIALGVLLAFAQGSVAYTALKPSFLKFTPLRWIVGVVLMGGLGVVPAGVVPYPWIAVSLISLALVFIASYDDGLLMRPGRLRSAMVWVGQRSFSMYLIHGPVFMVVRASAPILFPGVPDNHLTLRFGIMATVLLLGICEMSFRLIETPMRKRGQVIASAILDRRDVAARRAVSAG